MFPLLVIGFPLLATSPAAATEDAICACAYEGKLIVFFTSRPDAYGKLDEPVSVNVRGCEPKVECPSISSWHRGMLKPTQWGHWMWIRYRELWIMKANIIE